MSPAEILSRAADLIEPEGKWIQGHTAVNARGEAVAPHRPDAVCWCAIGAINASGAINDDPVIALAAYLGVPFVGDRSGLRPVAAWNDAPGRRPHSSRGRRRSPRSRQARVRNRGEGGVMSAFDITGAVLWSVLASHFWLGALTPSKPPKPPYGSTELGCAMLATIFTVAALFCIARLSGATL